MEKITGIAIVNGTASVVELEDDIKAYYDLIGCECIEIPTRTIGGIPYSIVCDENGLLYGDNHVSATNGNREAMLVGNIFIANELSGDLVSLAPSDIMNITRHLHRTRQLDSKTDSIRVYEVVECEYPTYEPIEEIETDEE